MSHCGQLSGCGEHNRGNGCPCGQRVRDEQEAAKGTTAAVSASVGDSVGRVGSRAIRALFGRQIESRETA